mmetsp:Transcript_80874/g.225046  ORF Transcript_80874/g.225046 Transcript_80874/m.225046 type:complete len:210 (+) Transcript_80874:84-713(+)
MAGPRPVWATSRPRMCHRSWQTVSPAFPRVRHTATIRAPAQMQVTLLTSLARPPWRPKLVGVITPIVLMAALQTSARCPPVQLTCSAPRLLHPSRCHRKTGLRRWMTGCGATPIWKAAPRMRFGNRPQKSATTAKWTTMACVVGLECRRGPTAAATRGSLTPTCSRAKPSCAGHRAMYTWASIARAASMATVASCGRTGACTMDNGKRA